MIAKAARYAWTAALVVLALLTIYLIRETLIVFVIALLLAYLLYPLMDLIDRHLTSKTRTPALAITFVLTLGFIALFGLFIGSVVTTQATNLAHDAPVFLDRLSQPEPPRRARRYIAHRPRARARSKHRFASTTARSSPPYPACRCAFFPRQGT